MNEYYLPLSIQLSKMRFSTLSHLQTNSIRLDFPISWQAYRRHHKDNQLHNLKHTCRSS